MPVAIVNETAAARFWGGAANAVGKRVRVAAGEWRMVIGVVRDIKYSRINEAPRPYVYLPFLQTYQPSMMLHARGSAGVAPFIEQLRAHVRALDPDLPILGAGTLSEQTRAALSILEMVAGVLFVFGGAGMALAAMGMYGLVSYTVMQSMHEIGIRMALGARGTEVVWHFLRRGLRLGAVGAVIGGVAALALTRLLGSAALRSKRHGSHLVRSRVRGRARRRDRSNHHPCLASRSDESVDRPASAIVSPHPPPPQSASLGTAFFSLEVRASRSSKKSSSECFLDRQVDPVRSRFSPCDVEAESGPRALVEECPQTGASGRRDRIEQPISVLQVGERRRVREGHHTEQSVARDRPAVLDFAIQESLATKAALSVAAG